MSPPASTRPPPRAPERARPPEKPQRPPHPPSGRAGPPDERSLEVTADPAWTALATSLAERSARLGRVYGVMLLSPVDRARLVQAAKATPGVQARAEGEGHWRRVTFVPDKLVPVSKKALMPDYDEDDEDE